jgi:hypothetical protein
VVSRSVDFCEPNELGLSMAIGRLARPITTTCRKSLLDPLATRRLCSYCSLAGEDTSIENSMEASSIRRSLTYIRISASLHRQLACTASSHLGPSAPVKRPHAIDGPSRRPRHDSSVHGTPEAANRSVAKGPDSSAGPCNSVESAPVGPYSLARSNRQNTFEITDFRHPGV